jgi:hypothetical protein
MKECWGCGEYFDLSELMCYDDKEFYCQQCIDELFTTCPKCGKIRKKKEIWRDFYGERMCYDCLFEHRRLCNVCGEWYLEGEVKQYVIDNGRKNVCYNCEKKMK